MILVTRIIKNINWSRVSVDSKTADFNESELETTTRTETELEYIKLQIRNIHSNVSSETNGKSMPDFDEDVIGIITLEDVMEELLQVRLIFLEDKIPWYDKFQFGSEPWLLRL